MQTNEKWEITIGGEKIEPEDIQLLEGILDEFKELVRSDAQRVFHNEIQNKIKDLSKRFIERGYNEDELTSEIMYAVNALNYGYKLTIEVSVYPTLHPDAYFSKNIVKEQYIDYVHGDYTKARNEQGTALKNKLSPMFKIINLQRELKECKKKLEEAEQIIRKQDEELLELRAQIRELEKAEEEEDP
ncbi:MAG: hypothetical protein JHC26_02100 [Thermofilum sp.]|uniref:hypothetical protein n=1 Tax=Thermofilum sp. TaxID=1961369 RepID=UPI00258D345C|nr:hypothetical protein [Thermofilum sp.]MCI4407856.1 hypothetical protein [Thermofilum sp.]